MIQNTTKTSPNRPLRVADESIRSRRLKFSPPCADNTGMSAPEKVKNPWISDQHGFTLVEVLVTILIIGIVMGIASSSWQGVVESRKVTSATNQLTADLRLANNKSTSQLKDYAVVTNLSSLAIVGTAPSCPGGAPADYYLVQIGSPITSSVTTAKCLPDGTEIDAAFGARFTSDGSAATAGGLTTTVSRKDGGTASNPKHTINVATQTSRVRVD